MPAEGEPAGAGRASWRSVGDKENLRAAGRSQASAGISSTWNMARGMRGAHLLAVLFTFSVTLFGDADGQGASNDLRGFSLNPPYFNLADVSSISATATCGQDEAGTPRRELYCKLVGGPNNGPPTQNIQVGKSFTEGE